MKNSTRRRTWIAAAIAALASTAPAAEDLARIRAGFASPDPPRTMGPLFWLHGGESPELIREMVAVMHEGGMGEFTIESRPHRDYLGPEWWEACRTAIEEAERRGMGVWIFDEKWFPSGVAGGKVLEASPRHRRHFLAEVSQIVEGPGERRIALPAGEEIVAVVAVPEDSKARLSDLTLIPGPWEPQTEIVWKAPSGRWRVCAYPLRSSGNYIDPLNPEAVACFIRLTQEATYEKLGRWFGRTIRGFFTDEPGFHNGGGEWPWTYGFAERFATLEGYDPRPLLPALSRDLGPDGGAFRHDYHEVLVDAYAETFYRPIRAWCRAHGVLSIGHVFEHDSLHYSLGAGVGDFFRISRYLDWGGIDVVFKQAWPGKESLDHWGMPKLASSAAHVFDLPGDMAFCETFGAYGWDLGLKAMKWLTDWQCVRGINYLCPHAFNPKWPDEDCPPFFYARGRNVQWPHFRRWADFANRVSYLLREGRHVAPVAVLYPAPSRWAGDHEPVERVAQALLCGQWDFDLLPYESFVRDGRIEGSSLAVAKEAYRALVLPGVEAIPIAVLEKIAAFRAAGGRALATSRTPHRACERGRHEDARALAARIWPAGSPALVLRTENLPAALRASGLEPDLEVSPPFRDIRYLRRERAGASFVYVTNESPRRDAEVDLLLSVPAGRASCPPEIWDPESGGIRAAPVWRVRDGRLVIPARIPRYGSLFVVLAEGEAAVGSVRRALGAKILAARFDAAKGAAVEARILSPSGRAWIEVETAGGELAWAELQGPPARTIDVASDGWTLRIAGEERPESLGSWTRHHPGFSGRARYARSIEVPPLEGADAILDLGEVEEIAVVRVNGREIGCRIAPPYRFDVGAALRAGENAIEIDVVNTLANAMHASGSRWGRIAESGLLGPVRLEVLPRVDLALRPGERRGDPPPPSLAIATGRDWVEARWESARPEPTRIEIRKGEGAWTSRTLPGTRQLHRIRVDGLDRGAAYRIRAAGAERAFETPPVSAISLEAGARVEASSTIGPGYPPESAIDGDRTGAGWAQGTGGWNDGTRNVFPDVLTVTPAGPSYIRKVVVVTLADEPGEPDEDLRFTKYGIVDFDVEVREVYVGWRRIAEVRGNDRVMRSFSFDPLYADAVRVIVRNALYEYSRIVELEAY